jgi:hypothetical protein
MHSQLLPDFAANRRYQRALAAIALGGVALTPAVAFAEAPTDIKVRRETRCPWREASHPSSTSR